MSRGARARILGLAALVTLLALALGPIAALASGGGHGEAAAGESSAKLWDLLWRALNFGGLVVLLLLLVRKPVAQLLNNRRQNIQKDLETLEARKKEAQQALEEAQDRLAEIRAEKERIIADFTAQGEAEKSKILAEAEALAAQLKAQAKRSIDQEIDQARGKLQEEIAELSAGRALTILQNKMTPQDKDRLVEEYLAKVVE